MAFNNDEVNLGVLKKRAYNMRWATLPDGVIPLTSADSDFPVAPEIKEAMISYIKDGYFCYSPNRGFPEFKQAIAKAFSERKNELVNPELVLPIDSAARGMDIIAKTILRPGDEAIVFDPVDFLFKTSMEAAGAKIVLYPMNFREDGTISFDDLESYITPKTKMLGLCNPHNPLGKVYPLKDLDHMLALSEKYEFYIMNDEIWSDIIYPEAEFTSILSLGNERNMRTMSVYGFSKSFGIAGLRVGCIYCQDEDLYEKIVAASLVDKTIGGISSLSQIAGIACLEKAFYRVEEFINRITQNRDYALKRISDMPGIKCHKPEATFVIFPDIAETGLDSVDLVNYLQKEHQLALVPGGARYFGPASAGHIRISLATSAEILAEGLDRLERGLKAIASKK